MNKKELQQKINSLINRVTQEIRVNIPKKDYPSINLIGENSTNYNPLLNEIELSKNHVNRGDVIGEEISHFIRNYILSHQNTNAKSKLGYYLFHPFGSEIDRVPSRNQESEKYTDEFFGYLGRDILQKVAKPSDNLTFKKTKPTSQKKALETLKRIKSQKRELEKFETEFPYKTDITYQQPYPNSETAKKHIKQLDKTREEILVHTRPYNFAQNLDTNKINLKELYFMSNKEVKNRFFRQDPQYNLKQTSKSPKITKRKTLEKITENLVIISLLILIITFIDLKITGHIINQNYANHYIIPLTLIIFILLIIILKKRIYSHTQT